LESGYGEHAESDRELKKKESESMRELKIKRTTHVKDTPEIMSEAEFRLELSWATGVELRPRSISLAPAEPIDRSWSS
jgi:hypothetical protein